MIAITHSRSSMAEHSSFEQLRGQESFSCLEADSRLEAPARRPWEVARWGRLLAGAAVLLFTALGLLHHPGWLVGTLGVALNQVATALTDRCQMRGLLLRLGAQEREDLFLPGGALRAKQRSSSLLKNGAGP